MTDAPRESDGTFGDDSADPLTRRRFVASGVALGAAVVWTANFPFSDAAIGQTIVSSGGPTGATGPTGAGEPTELTASGGQTGPTVGPAHAPGSPASGATTFTWAARGDVSGAIELAIHHPGTGQVKVLATHGGGPSRINYASLDAEVRGSGVSHLRLSPSHRGRSALRRSRRRHRHQFFVRVVLGYVPVDSHGVAQEQRRVTQRGKIRMPKHGDG